MTLLTPGPVEVHPDVLLASARPPLHHRSDEFITLSQRVWKRLQLAFQTESMVVVQAGSGMTGIESALCSVHSPGDHVLVLSHGRFGDRLPVIAERYGLVVSTSRVAWGASYDAQWVSEQITLAQRTHGALQGVWLVHAETSTGVAIDLQTVSAEIRRQCPTAIIGVDVVTSLAVQELRFDAWDLDVAVAGIQKGLACPPGLAVTALSVRALERVTTTSPRTYTLNLQTVVDHQQSGLFAWTPPVTLVAALDVSLSMLEMYGLDALWAEHQRRHQRILETARNLDIPTVGPPTAMGVVALRHPHSNMVRRVLQDYHHLRIAGGQDHLAHSIIRIGTMGGTWTDVMLERVISAIHHALFTTTDSDASLC